jgi:hypothetical protein
MHVASPLGLHGKKHNHRTPKRAFRGSVSFSTYLRVLIVRPSYYQRTERLSLNNCSYPISHRFLKLHSYFKPESQAAPTNTKSVSRRFHTSFSSHFIHDIKKSFPLLALMCQVSQASPLFLLSPPLPIICTFALPFVSRLLILRLYITLVYPLRLIPWNGSTPESSRRR